MFLSGLALGALSRLLDLYTQNLGNMFSEISIWILIGVLISIYSETQRKAMLNVPLFCFGMLIAYYFTAAVTGYSFKPVFIIGWTAFALCSPPLAALTRLSMRRGLMPTLIRVGIVLTSVLSSALLFDRLRVYDLFIDFCLIYFLFIKK